MPRKPTLELPKVSLSAIRQIFFVLRQAIGTAWEVNPKLLAFTFVLGGLSGLATLPTLYLGKAILDTVVNGIQSHNVGSSVTTLVILVVIRTLLDSFRNVAQRVTRRFNFNLSNQVDAHVDQLVARKIASLDIETIEDSNFRDKFERIKRQSGRRVWDLTNIIGTSSQDVFGLGSALTPIFLFNPYLVIVIIALILPGLFHESKTIKEDYELDKELAPKTRMWYSLIGLLTDKKDFLEQKLLGNSDFLIAKLKNIQSEVLGSLERLRNKTIKGSVLFDIPSWMFDAVLSVWLFVQAISGKVSLGTAQMIFSASGNFLRYFENISSNMLKIFENYLYMVDFVWFLNLKPSRADGTVIPKRIFTKGIEFKDVWFKYPKSNRWTLKNINFKIGLRENIAIVGENGAGKTTLIKLLGRFYEPTKGMILVNGQNIHDYKQADYWKRLSVLFQNFEHYSYSSRESIGYGDVERISDTESIVDAATQTGIHEFIDSLPKKYDTPLLHSLEGGVEPSGGQWQRIALARTIFRSAEIIVLDEPTSNVDPRGEEEIFKRIIDLTRKKILILISHRFSTVRRADRIFVMSKGKIVEEGSHDQLLKTDGLYAKLFNLQAKGYQ